MNIVDAGAWLEYFSGGDAADRIAPAIEDTTHLVVPVLCLQQVASKIMDRHGEDAALQAVAVMGQGRIIPMDDALALRAARLGRDHGLKLTDSALLATAEREKACILTTAKCLKGLPRVSYVGLPKKKRKKKAISEPAAPNQEEPSA